MTNKNFIITLILMLFMASATGFASDRYQWKLAGTEDGCQIHTSNVAGKDYIAAKATCVIPARIEVIGVILRDIPNYPEWMDDCKTTKILKTVDDEKDVFIFWLRQHVTMFPDRDVVLRSKTIIDMKNGRSLIYADSTSEIPFDTGKGYVRMPSFHSLFTLEWIDRENTRVTFMVDPDLGKGLPASIANRLIKTNPYKTLKNMMKMAKKSQYVEAAATSKYRKYVEDALQKNYIK
ncbi:MAG: hypothetical protein CVU51_10640 [Deltaproteobacteria bacterium HGW-Deltaproteobacteria-1]|nr:MAG: hypothetical protein CVU51_10640 [Deltaproteobacteria bacterium HGW-Deltaproteobacteria-1]